MFVQSGIHSEAALQKMLIVDIAMPLQKQPNSLFSRSLSCAVQNVDVLCERAERREPGMHLRDLGEFNLSINHFTLNESRSFLKCS